MTLRKRSSDPDAGAILKSSSRSETSLGFQRHGRTALDSSSIELKGSEIEAIDYDGDRLEIRFARAYLVKSMTGSAERTRWWQAGSLVIEGAEVAERPPEGPLVCAGGDLDENI